MESWRIKKTVLEENEKEAVKKMEWNNLQRELVTHKIYSACVCQVKM